MAFVISIIIPVLNEAASIVEVLHSLSALRGRGHEVIVVDGGSQDDTMALSRPLADRVVQAPRGRALQMNAGAAAAQGEILLFLHADSYLPECADQLIIAAVGAKTKAWGRFDVRLSGGHYMFRIIETMMNWRSRLTGIATGDQGVFVTRRLFEAAGGFPAIPLMEDIAFSRALKKIARPICLKDRLRTSSRRWEQRGIWRTILLMWRMRLAYALGADPAVLAKAYR
ncbi:MAG: TIGR04283 family arsenosugar biosynthesis glycosyltransferase [Pseudomonadota bacterium]